MEVENRDSQAQEPKWASWSTPSLLGGLGQLTLPALGPSFIKKEIMIGPTSTELVPVKGFSELPGTWQALHTCLVDCKFK